MIYSELSLYMILTRVMDKISKGELSENFEMILIYLQIH